MAVYAAAGAKLYIGSALAPNFTADLTAGDFAGQSWLEIAPLRSIGTIGDNAAVVTFDALGDGRTYKFKGTKNAGQLSAVAGFDPQNPGQAALIAAADSPNSFAFKIEPNDAPEGGTRSQRLFTGMVMSAAQSIDEANSVITLNGTVEVNSNAVFVPSSVSGAAPNNTVLPAITGTAEVGETLTCSTGTWTGTPTPALTYQWFKAGESIPGATANTYVPVSGDIGATLTCMVRATNVHGTVFAMSAATSTVGA